MAGDYSCNLGALAEAFGDAQFFVRDDALTEESPGTIEGPAGDYHLRRTASSPSPSR